MRYLFRGLIRDSGRPVEGHVEAPTEEAGYAALSGNGVVTESLVPDPKPLNLNDELPKSPEFADALESAFDSSSQQVSFDDLTERYTGKKVWVIDRDKIRRRVAQVVDAALALSAMQSESTSKMRERVQTALTAMFNDNRNLATERNAESVSGIRYTGGANGGASPPPPPPPPPAPVMPAVNRMSGFMPPAHGNGNGNGNGNGAGLGVSGHAGLENQVTRMAALVKQAEAALAAITAAARRGGGGGGGGGGRRFSSAKSKGGGEEQNSVLLEIFKSNLELVRGMQEPKAEAGAPEAPPEPAPAAAAEA